MLDPTGSWELFWAVAGAAATWQQRHNIAMGERGEKTHGNRWGSWQMVSTWMQHSNADGCVPAASPCTDNGNNLRVFPSVAWRSLRPRPSKLSQLALQHCNGGAGGGYSRQSAATPMQDTATLKCLILVLKLSCNSASGGQHCLASMESVA